MVRKARKQDGRHGRCYYADKRPVLTMLSPFAQRIVKAASRRTKRNRADVIEHLVRLHGGAVRFSEASTEVVATGR